MFTTPINAITKNTFCLKLAALTAMVPLLLHAAPSEAIFGRKSCKDVTIKVTNDSGKPIKIIDLEYYSKQTGWKNELVSNAVLGNNKSWIDTRNLEKVDDYRTKVRVQYRTLKSNGKWSWSVSEKDSPYSECHRGEQYRITVN